MIDELDERAFGIGTPIAVMVHMPAPLGDLSLITAQCCEFTEIKKGRIPTFLRLGMSMSLMRFHLAQNKFNMPSGHRLTKHLSTDCFYLSKLYSEHRNDRVCLDKSAHFHDFLAVRATEENMLQLLRHYDGIRAAKWFSKNWKRL